MTAKNIRPWGLDLSDITYVSADVHRTIFQRCPVQKHDVLYIKDGATTGLAVLNTLDFPFSVLSSVAVLRPKEDLLDPRFLVAWLNSPGIFDRMTGAMSGSAIRRLVLRTIRETQINFPPLDEQRRIVAKVEALLARVNAARARLARVPAILKRFRQSVLAAACSGRLTEEWWEECDEAGDSGVGWGTATLAELCESSFYGPRFGRDEYTDGDRGIPTIRTTDMTTDGRIEISASTPRVMVRPDDVDRFRVRKGDLLVTRTGSIGVMAVFEGEYVAIPSAYLIRFRFLPRVVPRYLFFCLMAPRGQEQMGLSTTAVTQPNINAEAIKRIEIPLPDLDEQIETVRRIEALFALADTIEQRAATALRCADRLTQSILSKAFRGDLMEPQPPR